MKRFLSVFLIAAVLITGTVSLAFAQEENISEYPVILVPGYSSSYFYNADTGEHVWGLDFGEVGNTVLEYIVQFGAALGALTVGNSDKIADLVGNGILDFCEQLKCNPDGTSKYNIEQYYYIAEDSRYSTLMEKYPDGSMRTEHEICARIAEYVTYDNLYQFTCDFRMGQEHVAGQLDAFIEDVCEFTGKDKVNLFAVSHGGQTVSTYIALYGYKNRINHAVLTVPAIGGAAFASGSFTGNVHLDEECIARFVEFGNDIEIDIDWFLKAHQLGFIDAVCEKLVPYVLQIVGNWGSIWDFIPVDEYEFVKSRLLDPDENALLIEKSDRYHYEIQPLVAEKMRECRANGSKINIIAGCGQSVVTGAVCNSDGIISTKCSTGAIAADVGQRFPDGYVQAEECGGKYKVSPSMTIDASTAYLPDNTWFFEGLFHGMSYRNPLTRELMMDLLFYENIEDVYSDPEYPQFIYSNAPADSVYFKFENGTPGYIDSDSGDLVITNTSLDSTVTISSVTCDCDDFSFRLPFFKTLKPGQSLKASVRGDIPEVSRKLVRITVCFVIDTITPQGYRSLDFTILNGEDVTAQSQDYISSSESVFGKLIGSSTGELLRKLGLYEYLSMIFEIVRYVYLSMTGLFA